MCGRYYLDPGEEDPQVQELLEKVKQKYKDTPELAQMKTGEIFPTEIVPVITAASPQLMQWGFSRFGGKGEIINARLETVAEKPMFRKAFFEHRCLIPASYFFEWEKKGMIKQKYALGSNELIYLAGVYRMEKESTVPRFVILTRPAAPEIAFIHDRIPVILPKEMHQAWFSGPLEEEDVLARSTERLKYRVV